MSITMAVDNSQPVSGTGTVTFTADDLQTINVQCKSTIPLGSGLQIVINQNGTPVVTVGGTSTNPSASQQFIAAEAIIVCQPADVITVVLSSSSAVDAAANAVKSVVSIFKRF